MRINKKYKNNLILNYFCCDRINHMKIKTILFLSSLTICVGGLFSSNKPSQTKADYFDTDYYYYYNEQGDLLSINKDDCNNLTIDNIDNKTFLPGWNFFSRGQINTTFSFDAQGKNNPEFNIILDNNYFPTTSINDDMVYEMFNNSYQVNIYSLYDDSHTNKATFKTSYDFGSGIISDECRANIKFVRCDVSLSSSDSIIPAIKANNLKLYDCDFEAHGTGISSTESSLGLSLYSNLEINNSTFNISGAGYDSSLDPNTQHNLYTQTVTGACAVNCFNATFNNSTGSINAGNSNHNIGNTSSPALHAQGSVIVKGGSNVTFYGPNNYNRTGVENESDMCVANAIDADGLTILDNSIVHAFAGNVEGNIICDDSHHGLAISKDCDITLTNGTLEAKGAIGWAIDSLTVNHNAAKYITEDNIDNPTYSYLDSSKTSHVINNFQSNNYEYFKIQTLDLKTVTYDYTNLDITETEEYYEGDNVTYHIRSGYTLTTSPVSSIGTEISVNSNTLAYVMPETDMTITLYTASLSAISYYNENNELVYVEDYGTYSVHNEILRQTTYIDKNPTDGKLLIDSFIKSTCTDFTIIVKAGLTINLNIDYDTEIFRSELTLRFYAESGETPKINIINSIDDGATDCFFIGVNCEFKTESVDKPGYSVGNVIFANCPSIIIKGYELSPRDDNEGTHKLKEGLCVNRNVIFRNCENIEITGGQAVSNFYNETFEYTARTGYLARPEHFQVGGGTAISCSMLAIEDSTIKATGGRGYYGSEGLDNTISGGSAIEAMGIELVNNSIANFTSGAFECDYSFSINTTIKAKTLTLRDNSVATIKVSESTYDYPETYCYCGNCFLNTAIDMVSGTLNVEGLKLNSYNNLNDNTKKACLTNQKSISFQDYADFTFDGHAFIEDISITREEVELDSENNTLNDVQAIIKTCNDYLISVDDSDYTNIVNWANTYLHMKDYTESQGYCLSYYSVAKSELEKLGSKCIKKLATLDVFNSYKERYEQWALANKDTDPYFNEITNLGLAYVIPQSTFSNHTIAAISLILITTTFVLFIIRLKNVH